MTGMTTEKVPVYFAGSERRLCEWTGKTLRPRRRKARAWVKR